MKLKKEKILKVSLAITILIMLIGSIFVLAHQLINRKNNTMVEVYPCTCSECKCVRCPSKPVNVENK